MPVQYFVPVWLAISIPVLLTFAYVYCATRRQGRQTWRSLAKSGATFTAVMTAVLGIVLYDRSPQHWLLVLGTFLCAVSDTAIEHSFLAGVVSFGLAHMAFIAYMIVLNGFVLWCLLPAVVLYLAALLIFRKQLWKAGKLQAPMLLYMAVLAVMTGMAAVMPFTLAPEYAVFAAGAVMFAVSDLFVARSVLAEPTGRKESDLESNLVLLLYYAAVYAMASVLLL